MNNQSLNESDTALRQLLREARPARALPPDFAPAVWRRIERAGTASSLAEVAAAWLERLADWLLRPRRAVAVFTALLLAGTLGGLWMGAQQNRQAAQERYVAAVSPNPLRY